MHRMTSRAPVILLALCAALALGGCVDGTDTNEADATASPTPSVRPTLAAPVPDGFVSAKLNPKANVNVGELITRLNALPGVLGAGFFADESRVVVRLKPDATKAQIDAAVAGILKEPALSDMAFEPPDQPSRSPSPSPSPAGSRPASPTATSY